MTEAPKPARTDDAARHAGLNAGEAIPVDERLLALEEKASFSEDLLDELNRTVARQHQQIESLARELVRLRGQVSELADGESAGSSGNEPPPHY
jgi:SlyX protein